MLDNIDSKIELLKAQIMNLEQSGRYTEKEMDRETAPLRLELAFLSHHIAVRDFGVSASLVSKSMAVLSEELIRASLILNPSLKFTKNTIVIDAEILTPNTTEA